jgi:hypothetical protein
MAILVRGLLIGVGAAVIGGVLGGTADGDGRWIAGALWGPGLLLMPTLAYLAALACLRAGLGVLAPDSTPSLDQLGRVQLWLNRAGGTLFIGVVLTGLLAFGGGLALLGPSDSGDNGAVVSGLVAWLAEWGMLVFAIMGLVSVVAAQRLAQPTYTAEAAWWWDGLVWRAVGAPNGPTGDGPG